MKVSREGQARILSREDEQRLWDFPSLDQRYKCLFATCLYTGCRISEALHLRWQNINLDAGLIMFPAKITKGQKHGREVPIAPELRTRLMWLGAFSECPPSPEAWVFPGARKPWQPVDRQTADHALRVACRNLGMQGVSTHSFRRSALTRMAAAGVPLRAIQSISGHRSLDALQRYLEVSPEDRVRAIAKI